MFLMFHNMLIRRLLLLATLPVALSFPSFTHTHDYHEESTQLCTTSFAYTSARRALPTYSSTATVQAQVVIILTRSLPAETITPTPTTVTETSNAYTDTTTTIDTITNTFYSTFTELSTISEQSTNTVTMVQTETDFSTTTSVTVVPTPPGFKPVADTAGIVNYTRLDVNAIDKQQARLDLRGIRDQTLFDLNGGLAHGDAAPAVYPAAVICNNYIKPTWTEIIALLRQTKTVTAPRSTMTATVTDTITSTSTVAPSVSTTLTTTETTFTTETAVDTSTEVQTTTTSILATVASTEYAACMPSNLIGPRVNDDIHLDNIHTSDRLAEVYENANDAYQCCALCQSKEFCTLSLFILNYKYCWQGLDLHQQCQPSEHVEGIAWSHGAGSPYRFVASNGRCGSWKLDQQV